MKHISEEEEECLIVGGDLNAIIGNERDSEENEKKSESREFIDNIINIY